MKIIFLFTLTFLSFFVGSSVSAQNNVHQVDFKNFTYNLSCGDADKKTPVTVRNGEYNGDKDGLGDVYLKINHIFFGDITKDGKDEAVILYGCGSGASYFYIWGLIYTIKNNKLQFLTDILGGNKADNGIIDIAIIKNLLIVKRFEAAEHAGSPCCPEFVETTKYRWTGRKLRQVSQLLSKYKKND